MVDIDLGPKVTIEALYGGAWFDMTCDVVGARMTRGRTAAGPRSWMTRMPAGEMRLRLDNSAGRYSSFTGDGNLALGEGTLVRLRAEWKGVHHHLFVGYVEQWDERWTQATDEVDITIVDPLGLMSEQGGAFDWVPGRANQTVAARIEQLLGRVGITSQPFYSDEGFIRCIAPRLTSTTVIDEVHRTALSDHGMFFHEPAPIVDPADTAASPSQWVYLDRLRFDRVDATRGAPLPAVPVATDSGDWRNVDGPLQRTYTPGMERPAQASVPVFSDACVGVEVDLDELEYTDIEWRHVAFERPSLVAVTNRKPPEERDTTGLPLPLPWAEAAAAIGSGDATRHNIISLTDLRFSTDFEARQLAASVVNQLRQQKIEVSRLVLWPHRDPAQFDALLALRLQDQVVTVRNLVHGGVGTRIEMASLVEGIEIGLVPRPGWATDSRRAEWTVRFTMSPLLAAVEDIPILPPPPVDPPVDPTYTYVAAAVGQRPAGASTAIPVTGLGADVTLAFDTNQPGDLAGLVFIEAENTVTLARQRLNRSAAMPIEPIAGGRRAAAIVASAASLIPGVTYRFRVVEDRAPTFYASNWVTMAVPLPTPSKPTIVDLDRWRFYTYTRGVGATPTTVTWPNVSNGVLYQVGIKPDHAADENYEPLALQSGNSAVLTLGNDTNYSIAVRIISGGATSPWSAPLRASMGHPERIDRIGTILLNDDVQEQSRGRDQLFVGTVRRLITPPPNGPGDGQWTHTPDMFDLDSPNFIGTIIERVEIRAGNVNSQSQFQGPTLRVDAFGIQPRVVVHGVVPFGAYSAIPTSVPNPSFRDDIEGWSMPIKAGVRDSNDTERDRRFGLLPTGAAYSTHPTGYTSQFDLRLIGNVEVFGTECIPTARLSNRVVG